MGCGSSVAYYNSEQHALLGKNPSVRKVNALMDAGGADTILTGATSSAVNEEQLAMWSVDRDPRLDWSDIEPGEPSQGIGEMVEISVANSRGFHTEFFTARVSEEELRLEFEERNTSWYSFLQKVNHELALFGDGSENSDSAILAFDSPSSDGRSAIRLLLFDKDGVSRSVLHGARNRGEVLKRVKSGELLPGSGLQGRKDGVSLGQILPGEQNLRTVEVSAALLKLEASEMSRKFKWGVLNARAGQLNEDSIYSNQETSSSHEYREFLNILGDVVALDGFTGYRGGLDNRGSNATGEKTVWTKHPEHPECEVMFHVATMLPFQAEDPQRVERKRHIGNDIVVIVFREQDAPPFDPCVLTTQFTNVFCVVSFARRDPDGVPCYRLVISNKTGMPFYRPVLSQPEYRGDDSFRLLLLTKLMNAERAALYHSPDFKFKMSRTRRGMIQDTVRVGLAMKGKKKTAS